jgi:hypothetical protein
VEERLHRAVARLRLVDDLERRVGDVLGELGAQARGRSSSRRSPPRRRPPSPRPGGRGTRARCARRGRW